jgi:hypothetical protein
MVERIRLRINRLAFAGLSHIGRPGLVEGTRELVEPPYIVVYTVDDPADEITVLGREGSQQGGTLMRNRAGNFSVGRLMKFLTALGQDVRITVKPTRKAVGEMEVVVG